MVEKNPLSARQLARRRGKSVSSKISEKLLPIADVSLAVDSDLVIRRNKEDEARLRILCNVGENGMSVVRRREKVEAIQLDLETVGDAHLKVRELDGMIPDGTKVSFDPEKAELTSQQKAILQDLRSGKKTDDDKGATIFGNDDRFLFFDRTYPWRTTGRVRTAGGVCAGCTIGPRLVLTASHCVNWSDDGSSAGWITFAPGYYDGDAPWGEIAATQIIYWNPALGLLSDQETAFDYVVLVMEEDIGNIVGYPGYRTYNDDWNDGSFWQIIGYPGDLSGTQRPSFQGEAVITSVQDHNLNGQTGFVMGHFNDITPGNSGGPCWGWWSDEPWPRVVGVASTIGSTAVQAPHGSTVGDNEFGGGPALSSLISWARANFPA